MQLRCHNSMAEHSLCVGAHPHLEQNGVEDTQCSLRNLHIYITLKQQRLVAPVTASKH